MHIQCQHVGNEAFSNVYFYECSGDVNGGEWSCELVTDGLGKCIGEAGNIKCLPLENTLKWSTKVILEQHARAAKWGIRWVGRKHAPVTRGT